jgi:hypothetical protein
VCAESPGHEHIIDHPNYQARARFLQRCGELWLRKYREKKVARGTSMSGIQKRATQQLATVYKALQGDHSHPSADEIYQRVRQSNIGDCNYFCIFTTVGR